MAASSLGLDKDALQRVLDKDKWYTTDIKMACENRIVIERQKLEIWDANLPVDLLKYNLARVRRLEMYRCRPKPSNSQSPEKPTADSHAVEYLFLGGVSNVHLLLHCGVTFPHLKELHLRHCSNINMSVLSGSYFPSLAGLTVNGTSVQFNDTKLPSLRRLSLTFCGSVTVAHLIEACCQLEELIVEGDTIVADTRAEWKTLKKLTLDCNTRVKHLDGRTLSKPDVEDYLKDVCKNAILIICGQVVQDPRFRERCVGTGTKQASEDSDTLAAGEPDNELDKLLRTTEMHRLYQESCLHGTQEVYQTRLMLVGHFGAGKTSLKRSLLHQPFIPEHKSTNGLDKMDEIVVIEAANNWKTVAVDKAEDFKRETAKSLKEQTRNSEKSSCKKGQDLPEEKRTSEPQGTCILSEETGEKSGSKFRSGDGSQKALLSRSDQVLLTKLDAMKIEVFRAALLDPIGNDEQFTLTIWDFGGQHVYYTSHQTFLSPRAVYLLVMDISQPLDSILEPCEEYLEELGTPCTPLGFLDFWLNSIHTHLTQRGRSDDIYYPPVIIVCAKTDKLKLETRRSQIRKYIASIEKHLQGKPYFEHVCDIIPVSNCEVENAGIEELRSRIAEVSKEQPYWGEKRPTKWLLLANDLRQSVESLTEPLMKLSELQLAAKRFGMDDDEVEAFLTFHHNLGELVYFNETGTCDTVILSAQWLASIFSRVITQDSFLGKNKLSAEQLNELKQGMLSESTLFTLCGSSQARTLAEIMQRFDMIAPCRIRKEGGSTEEVILVPCLLPKVTYQKAQEDEEFPKIHFKLTPKTLHHLCHLDVKGFLPNGLFHRLISMCCRTEEWTHHEESIFCDYIVIEVEEFFFSLSMVHDGITLSAFNFQGKAEEYAMMLAEIRNKVQSLIEEITIELFPNLRCVQCLECNCTLLIGSKSAKSYAAKQAMKRRGFIQVDKRSGPLGSRVFCDNHKMIVETKPWDIWFGLGTIVENVSEFGGTHPAEALKKELQPHMPHLLKSMPHKVIDNLIAAGLLFLDEADDISKEPTPRGQNLKLYQLVLSRVKSTEEQEAAKRAVCKGLCESCQYCPIGSSQRTSDSQPATGPQKAAILKMRPHLIEDLEVEPVLDKLIQARIVDQYICELIRAPKARRDRVDKLLLFVLHTHSQAHDIFLDIIKEILPWLF